MSKKIIKWSPLALAITLSACGGGESQPSDEKAIAIDVPTTSPVKLELTVHPLFAALYTQKIVTNNATTTTGLGFTSQAKLLAQSAPALQKIRIEPLSIPDGLIVTEDTRFDGQMLVTSISTGAEQTLDWPITLKTDTSVVSHRTLSLAPDTYDFVVILEKGTQQYIAQSLAVVITNDTTPEVNLVLQPHLGNTSVTLEDINELAKLNFQFDVTELKQMLNPKLGISLDGGDELVYALNKDFGITQILLSVGDGDYELELKLYDDNRLVGMMRSESVNILLEEGVTTSIDIIPLSADVDFSFDMSNNESTFNIAVPEVLIDRVGGVDKLALVMRLNAGSGEINSNSETIHGFKLEDGIYKIADSKLPLFETLGQDTVTAYLSFYTKREDNQYSGTPLASCSFEVEVEIAQTFGCELNIDVSHQISGSLLSTLMLSVVSGTDPELAKGASVYLDETLIGLTGSQFNTASLKTYLSPGEHSIRVEKGQLTASFTETFAPLSVTNRLLYLADETPPEITFNNVLPLATGVKTFLLSWQDNENWASEYQVCLYNETLVDSEFCSPLGDPVTDTQAEVYLESALLTDNPQFMILARNGSQSVASDLVTPSRAQLDAAIGYFKASYIGGTVYFGRSVALSADGKVMAVGARAEASDATGLNGDQTNRNASGTGAVYLFKRDGKIWQQTDYIKPSIAKGQSFGSSLDLSANGQTLVVGARSDGSNSGGINADESDTTAVASGAIYVFRQHGGTWSQEAYIKPNQPDANDYFGAALDLSDDANYLVVGANGEDSRAIGVNDESYGGEVDNNSSYSGAAYIFAFNSGVWSQQVYFKASNAEAGDFFGSSVAINSDGSTLVVGATGERSSDMGINGVESNNSAVNRGAAYVFQRQGDNWTQQAYVKPNSSTTHFGKGASLSSTGDTLAIGGSNKSFIYQRINGQWQAQAYLDYVSGISLASQLRLSADGQHLFIGNSTGDNTRIDSDIGTNVIDGDSFVGIAVQYSLLGDSWQRVKNFRGANTGKGDQFGTSLAIDATGSTLAIGAIGENSSATGVQGNQSLNDMNGAGAVYIY
ncbi:FG-GAP repeat protein [Shewanella violacea]|uniref:Integrin alpha beta-propellor repeat protein n=1 Tax=Shewanella violacea (strain JCM 10179 / CIP 106290 / LMG 19151 / DSS12) TaxID=637905 RepID=D4ZGK5_SHEVD|nr:FG-GAP repeat protein [Shewanella violacea]BAJ00804.1 hypothetical protein SVI_0833 [Shewanella violacea DSS12]